MNKPKYPVGAELVRIKHGIAESRINAFATVTRHTPTGVHVLSNGDRLNPDGTARGGISDSMMRITHWYSTDSPECLAAARSQRRASAKIRTKITVERSHNTERVEDIEDAISALCAWRDLIKEETQ